MHRGATYTGQTISASDYCRILSLAKETAERFRPGLIIKGVVLQNGIWNAITTAGTIPLRELSNAKPSDYGLVIPNVYRSLS